MLSAQIRPPYVPRHRRPPRTARLFLAIGSLLAGRAFALVSAVPEW